VFILEGVGPIELIVDGARFLNLRGKKIFRSKDASYLASYCIWNYTAHVTCCKKGFF